MSEVKEALFSFSLSSSSSSSCRRVVMCRQPAVSLLRACRRSGSQHYANLWTVCGCVSMHACAHVAPGALLLILPHSRDDILSEFCGSPLVPVAFLQTPALCLLHIFTLRPHPPLSLPPPPPKKKNPHTHTQIYSISLSLCLFSSIFHSLYIHHLFTPGSHRLV